MPNFAIVTPAHNEEAYLENTIRSVLAQRHLPGLWVIANDGSTDGTKAIAERYARDCPLIKTMDIVRPTGRAFGNKARAFNSALTILRGYDFDFIGNLDADILLKEGYFDALLQAMARDDRLGITGGAVYTRVGRGYLSSDDTLDSVAGAVQFFRRRCLDDIGGGYLPLRYGGIDAAAEITARMRGWAVRKLREQRVYEQRQTGTADAGPSLASYRLGYRFYTLGYSPLFFMLRSAYRLLEPPLIVGSIAGLAGYFTAAVKREPLGLPADTVAFLRREQRHKLLSGARQSIVR